MRKFIFVENLMFIRLPWVLGGGWAGATGVGGGRREGEWIRSMLGV